MAVRSSASTATRERTRAEGTASGRSPWRWLVAGLLIIDAAALGTAFALSYLIRFKAGLPFLGTPPHQLSFYSYLTFVAIPGWLGVFAMFHLYDRAYLFAGFGEYVRVANAAVCAIMATIAMGFLQDDLSISRGWLSLDLLLSILAVGAGRFGARRALGAFRRRGYCLSRTVVVGANEEGQALADQFARDPACGIRVVGFVDSGAPVGTTVFADLTVIGPVSALRDVIQATDAAEVVVAMTAVSRDEFLDLYRSIGHDLDPEIRLTSGLYEI